MKLNGKTRYRTTWRGRLVLQVQIANMAGTWRDAKVSDLDCGGVSEDVIGVYEAPLHWNGLGPIPRNPLPMPPVKPLKQE